MNPLAVLRPALVLVVALSCCVTKAQEKSEVLLVTGQASRYHNWQIQSSAFQRILQQAGIFDIHVVTAPAAGEDMSTFSPHWSNYAAVVVDYDGDEWSDATKKSFENFVRNGGGVVVVHGSDNAFPKWNEYNEMIGIGGWGGRTEAWGPKVRWRDGKTFLDESAGTAVHPSKHDFLVVSRAPEHPIMKGLPVAWLHANDELCSQLRGPAKRLTVLATASAAKSMRNGTGENEPILMAIEYGKGRVFHTTLGHVGPKETEPVDSISCVGFTVTLQRGTEWAATGKVTQKIPDDFPTSDQKSVRAGPEIKFPISVGQNPESITKGFSGNYYVTVMNGAELGDGEVVEISKEGVRVFAKGFDQPKGIVFLDNHLYFSDVTRVWKVDEHGNASVFVDKEAFPKEVLYLNDVAMDAEGQGVYLTDMGATKFMRNENGALWPLGSKEATLVPQKGRVYHVDLKGRVTVAQDSSPLMLNPNGVGVDNNGDIMVGAFFLGNFLVKRDGKLTPLTGRLRGADAVEQDSKGNYYVSSWTAGKVWRIDGNTEESTVLIDGLRSAADFYLEEDNERLLLPDMKAGLIYAVGTGE